MFLIVIVLVIIPSSLSAENNVCPTFEDYYNVKNNSRCWHHLGAENTAPEVIKLYGYPVMEYRVPTADGFVLRMYRIPSSNPQAYKHPIYMQHGLVATCSYFLALGKDSLAFVLADAGYDVWLGNYRGNLYSEEHMNLTVFDNEYWEHSMDDIVKYDFPALFQTILSNSAPDAKIIYMGHSLGTTLALMFSAEYPEVAQNWLKILILMSPAYTLSNMISPYRKAAPFGPAIINMVWNLGMFRIVSQAEPLSQLVRTMCLESPPLMRFCMQLYNLFYGANTVFGPVGFLNNELFNIWISLSVGLVTQGLILLESLPVYFNNIPGGTALRILNQAADMVLGNFRKYNYVDKNYEHYGSLEPPIYDIKKLLVPVYLVYSTQDWATTEADAINLWNNLPPSSRWDMRRIDLPAFNHNDFVYGRNAKKIVYIDLLEKLTKIIST